VEKETSARQGQGVVFPSILVALQLDDGLSRGKRRER